jgi:hypothetical protein
MLRPEQSGVNQLAPVVGGRGRPPEAAARRPGLEVVEKLLTTSSLLPYMLVYYTSASATVPQPGPQATGTFGALPLSSTWYG